MDDLTDLIERINESRAHCGMCGEQAVVRNSRGQYICEACLHETIPTPPYRMRWEAADAIEVLQARVAEARNAAFEDAAKVADQWATEQQRKFGNGGPAAAIRAMKDAPTDTPPSSSHP